MRLFRYFCKLDDDEAQVSVLNPIKWIFNRELMVLFEDGNICNMLENSFFVAI